VIIERLVRAARRGVKIHILAKKPHSLKADKLIEGVGGLRILQDVGAKVHTMKHLKLHAKMLLADSKRAIIGSINLAPGSFDARRELAIETDDPVAVKRLEETAMHDWSMSHPLDLSDTALLADLQKRDLDPASLALNEDSEHWGYHHNGHHEKHAAKHDEAPGDKTQDKHGEKHHADKG
jgi:cardiolipin synthase